MYHPSRGGVRGGRDQFSWDDVKVDKHRENYLGHSIKAPVGRWQKGKDLHWYSRDKKSQLADEEAMKEEIKRIKEQEEQAMREALGLAPQRASRPQTNRLDKHEMKELVKRGSTAEDLGAGHAEAAHVQGLGYARPLRVAWEELSLAQPSEEEHSAPVSRVVDSPKAKKIQEPDDLDAEHREKKRRREEKKRDHHERNERHEKRHGTDSGDRKHRRHDKKRGHDSD